MLVNVHLSPPQVTPLYFSRLLLVFCLPKEVKELLRVLRNNGVATISAQQGLLLPVRLVN